MTDTWREADEKLQNNMQSPFAALRQNPDKLDEDGMERAGDSRDVSGPMDIDMFKLAIDDSRTRHKAVVDLIFFNDNQAMNLLRLYVSLSLASASAAVAIFGRSTNFPDGVGYGLLITALILIYGSYECFRAMGSGSINLPGRDPDFWLWARGRTTSVVSDQYLGQLQERADFNWASNVKSAKRLKRAKLAGLTTVPAALVAGLVAVYLEHGLLISL